MKRTLLSCDFSEESTTYSSLHSSPYVTSKAEIYSFHTADLSFLKYGSDATLSIEEFLGVRIECRAVRSRTSYFPNTFGWIDANGEKVNEIKAGVASHIN